MTTDSTDLISAVLLARDEIDPDLDSELLKAIVGAETAHPEGTDEAMKAIETAVSEAIDRGVAPQASDLAATSIADEEEGS